MLLKNSLISLGFMQIPVVFWGRLHTHVGGGRLPVLERRVLCLLPSLPPPLVWEATRTIWIIGLREMDGNSRLQQQDF